MGLVGIEGRRRLRLAAGDSSPAVRMGVLLALRRLEDPAVAEFLSDADPSLVLEAARAINDVPIDAAMPRLAALKVTAESPAPAAAAGGQRELPAGPGGERCGCWPSMAGRLDLPEPIRVLALRCWANGRSPRGATR